MNKKFNDYFFVHEFDCPTLAGSGSNMQDIFINKLTRARHRAGIPFIIVSGYRTPEHNTSVGGVSDSEHLKGNAADIFCVNSNFRFLIIKSLLESGFSRIGIGSNFIHVDDSNTKPKYVSWVY